MTDRFTSPASRLAAARVRVLRPVERRPIGTNGYVSTWGAVTSVCPPKGC
ncbi:hypothetical protein [Streptomyces capillispiralis]|nr:hypothetical protein [Streptomyces capillispiralis]GHH95704.1 hypothetical protein GCM10017779_61610 [Streptomyces capillispiralis]